MHVSIKKKSIAENKSWLVESEKLESSPKLKKPSKCKLA